MGAHTHLCRFPVYQDDPEIIDRQWHLARAMRPVDDNRDIGLESGDDVLDRKDQRRRRRDMVDDGQLRLRRHGGEDRLGDLIRAFDGKRHPGHHHVGPGPLAGEAEDLTDRVVVMGGGQQLVAGPEQGLE